MPNEPTQGEYRGDFTRDTFNPTKKFSRVLLQQGRVLLDADWNEQTSILLHYLRTLAADLIGPHGCPAHLDGAPGEDFAIASAGGSFAIGLGHYYVDGILCENRRQPDVKEVTYFTQPYYPRDTDKHALQPGILLVYLDVWERHVTHLQDGTKDDPNIREVALGPSSPDTATRAQVVWQVKVKALKSGPTATDVKKMDLEDFRLLLSNDAAPGAGKLMARAQKPKPDGEECPCVISPESRYRGPENQLYRVEIHKPGLAGDEKNKKGKSADKTSETATFKWSRENASVAFPIRTPLTADDTKTTVALQHLGRDARLRLKEGDWVEIVDDHYILQNGCENLLPVDAIDRDNRTVILKGTLKSLVGQDMNLHPLLRRWDSAGEQIVQVPVANDGWIALEDGVEIQFVPGKGPYQTGDYWLIPARVATGDVEWPGPASAPASLPPHGVEHRYAPLAFIVVDAGGKVTAPAGDDCRRILKPIPLA